MFSKIDFKKLFVGFAGISIIGGCFFFLLFVTDKILISYLMRNRKYLSGNHAVGKALNLQKKDSLNKSNYGEFLTEGILVDKVVARGGHHDDELDHTVKGKSDNIVWVFGDSWGRGIRNNEKKNKTLQTVLNFNFEKLRIIASGSWSPLTINLAARNRSEVYNESPDQVVIFLDQTDIGNDYCGLRPFVNRNSMGRVSRIEPNLYNFSRNDKAVFKIIFNDSESGLIYAFGRLLNKIENLIGQNGYVPGLTECTYHDNLAWQLGKIKTRNGTLTANYVDYFRNNIKELINEFKLLNPEVNILIVTHDWAQHGLNPKDKNKFEKNISTIVSEVSRIKPNVRSFHMATEDYDKYNVKLKNIYLYPGDIASHLKDYQYLSKEIGYQLNKIISNNRISSTK